MTLAQLETDASIPSWPTALALASALGVTCQEFPDVAKSLQGSEKRTPRPVDQAKKKPAREKE